MSDERLISVDRLPTLTEVLEVGHHLSQAFWEPPLPDFVGADTSSAVEPPVLDLEAEVAGADAGFTPAQPLWDEAALVARVMAELEPRVAHLLEARLREALAPALARAADTLIRETRVELAAATRSLVEESLAQALRQTHRG